MFKTQRYLTTAIKRSFANRKNFTGRYKVAKEEKYEGIKNKPVYEKAMKKGMVHDPELEFNDYLELENGNTKNYTPESDEIKEQRLQEFLDSKTSIEDKMHSYLSTAKTDKEMMIKSEKLIQAHRKKDLGSLFAEDNQEILDEYNRYDYYRMNYIDKTNNGEMKLKDESKMFRNEIYHHDDGINDFFNNLDPEITKDLESDFKAKNIEALNILKSIESQMEILKLYKEDNITDRGEKDLNNVELTDLQKKLTDEFRNTAKKHQKNISGPIFERKFTKLVDESMLENPIDRFETIAHKPILVLSLRSKIEVYRLYLEGWSIKDLCMRFGISPQRVKLTIWNFQYFIEDVLPFSTPEQVIESIYLELNPPEDVEAVDYGLDLELLHKFQAGHEVNVFAKHHMDHIPKTNKEDNMSEKEIEEKLKKTKVKREDQVIEKIVSTGSPPYYIKNWIVYRGQGMMRVNRMFKKIVERSHYKDHLPHRVVEKLDQGPRIASLGFGVK